MTSAILQAGYAAGVQVTVNVTLDSGKGGKPIQVDVEIQQVTLSAFT